MATDDVKSPATLLCSFTTPLEVQNLKRHLSHRQLFGPPPPTVVGPLVRALRDNPAQRTPVEVLPDGSVIAGHEWVKAAKEAGLAQLVASILPELAKAGEAAIEAYVIDRALHSAHHGRMAKLRALQRSQELFGSLPTDLRRDYHVGDVVRHAMQLFGKDRRTVLHYTALLNTPRPIQDALDNGELDLKSVKGVAKLPGDVQAKIARAIQGGKPPLKVVRQHVASPSGRHQGVLSARDAAVKSLERVLTDLGDRASEVTWLTGRQQDVLLRARNLIDGIMGQARVVDETSWRANQAAQRSGQQGEQTPEPAADHEVSSSAAVEEEPTPLGS